MNKIYKKPWGSYEIISLSNNYQVKRIVVKPEQKLSLQSHKQREEHWIIVGGEGLVLIGETNTPVKVGSSVIIPIDVKHRIENSHSSEDLVFIEVQIGSYLGEDDIVRYEEISGRL